MNDEMNNSKNKKTADNKNNKNGDNNNTTNKIYFETEAGNQTKEDTTNVKPRSASSGVVSASEATNAKRCNSKTTQSFLMPAPLHTTHNV
jgi:predicted lipase